MKLESIKSNCGIYLDGFIGGDFKKIFLNTLEAHYKVKPIIYTYAHFYTNYLSEGFDEYPLWIAHYFEPQGPRINKQWQFWQHSERGRVNGIKANVDFNVFNGDSMEFKQLLLP